MHSVCLCLCLLRYALLWTIIKGEIQWRLMKPGTVKYMIVQDQELRLCRKMDNSVYVLSSCVLWASHIFVAV